MNIEQNESHHRGILKPSGGRAEYMRLAALDHFSFGLFFLLLASVAVYAAHVESPQTCFECHADRSLVSESDHQRSLFVDKDKYARSIHGKLNCIDCHIDADVEDFPHASPLKPAQCGSCHAAVEKEYRISRHAETAGKGNFPGAACSVCHGKHDILSVADPRSPANAMNIPGTCGTCHNEKSSVPMAALQNALFSDALHARGLQIKGIKVTAVCTSCHGAHAVLRSNDRRSSVSREKCATTCQQCHSRLEAIHAKVIKKGIWRAGPTSSPVCVDCHEPHPGLQHVVSSEDFTDRFCQKCHSDTAGSLKNQGPRPRFVSTEPIQNSAHKNVPCVQCHVDISKDLTPVCAKAGKVNCASCHGDVAENYASSIHGVLHAKNDRDAPSCVTCHGAHEIQPKLAKNSPIGRRNSPALCGQCHQSGGIAALRNSSHPQLWEKYKVSVHGKGLEQSGLMVSAICVDCHTSHCERSGADTSSSVNRAHIAETCSKCHQGIYEEFSQGIHSSLVTATGKQLPVCSDCHSSHSIQRVTGNAFRQEIMDQCGKCHQEVAATYFETYHGKGSRLGSEKTARCSDCHGSHAIRKPGDPRSLLSAANIVSTCKKCHPKSNKGFAGFLTHASPSNKAKYPVLFYVFWGMNFLLIGTLTFFGVHTLLWLPRSLRQRFREQQGQKGSTRWVRRFSPFYRLLHVFVIISFLGLALTGTRRF
jgi:hypothetical protein